MQDSQSERERERIFAGAGIAHTQRVPHYEAGSRNINVYILVLRLLLKTFTATATSTVRATARARKMYNFYSKYLAYLCARV